MVWSEEVVSKLREMWEDGAVVQAIVDEIGAPSRNAVIGKAHRLNLPPRPSPLSADGRAYYRDKGMGLLPPMVPERPYEWTGAALALDNLRNGCRWPLGDPRDSSFRYCGCAKRPEENYCQTHKAMGCIQDARRRRPSDYPADARRRELAS